MKTATECYNEGLIRFDNAKESKESFRDAYQSFLEAMVLDPTNFLYRCRAMQCEDLLAE